MSKIKKALMDAGITQKELAEKTGLSRSSISQYFSGRLKPPEKALRKMAEALNLSFDSLTDTPVVELSPRANRNLPVKIAARLMGKCEQFVRIGLQRGILQFGYAIKGAGDRYSYYISPVKFAEHTGADLEKEEIG